MNKDNSKRLIGRTIVRVTQIEPDIGERFYNANRMNPAFRIWLDDGTIVWGAAGAGVWRVRADGSRRITVRMWDGSAMQPVIDDDVTAAQAR